MNRNSHFADGFVVGAGQVWPIMHIVAMRKAILDEHPWAAPSLCNAFLQSRRRSIERLLDPASRWRSAPASKAFATAIHARGNFFRRHHDRGYDLRMNMRDGP
jgi:hypothetical protein